MKKKMFILGTSLLLLCGCGKIPKLSNGDEAVVTFKDGEKISANDFYNAIKDKMGLDTLIGMIDKYIYEKEFDDKMNDAKQYAEAAIKQLRTTYSSDEEILSMIRYSGLFYQTIDAYQEYLYLNYLQNEAIKAYVGGKITEDELKKYYEDEVYPNMNISHIMITSKATSSATDEEKEKFEKEAKDKAKEVIKKLNDAKKENKNIEDVFGELAKEYSEDSSTKDKKGDLGEINLGSLNSQYDELVKAAVKLKDGEYSTDVITTEVGYHVILKTKTGTKKSYEDSLEAMKEKILNNKLNDEPSLMIEAVRSYREKYDMDIIDSEVDSQYGKYMNNLINSYKNANK